MSPQSGSILVNEIAPRLRSAIPNIAMGVGSDDTEELVQDAIAMAAQTLDNLERRGKEVTPGNIAYYVILQIKSGGRSTGRSRTDVMREGTRLDGKSTVLSLEEEIGYDPELNEPIRLGDFLADSVEDPSVAGARNADWDSFLESRDYRYSVIAKGLAEGKSRHAIAQETGEPYHCIHRCHEKMADELREFMGTEAIADALRVPIWQGNITAERERSICKAERQRASGHSKHVGEAS